MAREIPIQNLYYLLTYAWDHFPAGGQRDIDAEECPDLANLFTRVLASGLQHLARRGLDREYVPHVEETPRLRGRIRLLPSERRLTRLRGRMECEFDDLSHDVLHNQLLRATADRLLACADLESENRRDLRRAREPLLNVRTIAITAPAFRRVQLHRNNRLYHFLLNLCALIHRCLLPNEQSGRHRFQDLLRDEIVMSSLFEKFVRSFAIRHCNARVSAKHVAWSVECDEAARRHLPAMITDVTIEWPQHQLIVDCKFYKEALTGRWEPSSLHSGHLYQLLAYLQNQALQPDWSDVQGMLLYPTVEHVLDHRYILLGRRVRVATINLDQAWPQVHEQLLALLAG